MKFALSVAFLACVPLANWMIEHVGLCIPGGPCLIPVGLGLMAPSGVLVVGASFLLRDAVRETCGRSVARNLVLGGAVLSYAVASAELALASGVTFLVAEGLDAWAFSRVRATGFLSAVLASSAVGLVVDSAIFLGLAFGSLEHLWGQILGKAWALLAGASCLLAWREISRRSATSPEPGR
jgi:uncharacterized PurR-regulated membrane protein YhhQ (DUF165 family)